MLPDRIYNKLNPEHCVDGVTYRNDGWRGSITFDAKNITERLCIKIGDIVTFSPCDVGDNHDYIVIVASTDYIECDRV